MIAYASRTGTRRNLSALRARGWRLLVSAAGVLRTEGFEHYALDNGAWSDFKQGRPFDEQRFLRAFLRLGPKADWVVVPDVVEGGRASLELSLRWLPRVLEVAPCALLAVQDGLLPADVRPFLSARVGLFVGGSDIWKEQTAYQWIQLGRAVGCWVHGGRVNTVRRIRIFSGATSIDGTSASRFAVTLPMLDGAIRQGVLPL